MGSELSECRLYSDTGPAGLSWMKRIVVFVVTALQGPALDHLLANVCYAVIYCPAAYAHRAGQALQVNKKS